MKYTRVKICGITNLKDAELAVSLGADALGFIFCESSRQVSIPEAKKILSQIPPFVNKVAVVQNFSKEKILDIISKLPIDTLQFHGEETEDFCLQFYPLNLIKVIAIQSEKNLKQMEAFKKMNYFLLDTYSKQGGGAGLSFNWDIAVKAKAFGNITLAGGLNPDNIKNAINIVSPYGVDVSSGVEISPGTKDPEKIKLFIQRAKFSS